MLTGTGTAAPAMLQPAVVHQLPRALSAAAVHCGTETIEGKHLAGTTDRFYAMTTIRMY